MSEDLIKRSDTIKAYNEAMDELVKWQMDEWQLGDFSECEFNTTDCKHIARKITSVPSIDLVRCKECYMCDEEMWCSFFDSIMESDDFCSYGERREP